MSKKVFNDLNMFIVNSSIQTFKHEVNQVQCLELCINHAF